MDKLSLGAKLRLFAEAYGVAVRAGCLTPNADDERVIREMFSLPAMNADVVAEWARTDGVRLPITLKEDEEPEPLPSPDEPAKEDDEK